MDFSQMNMGELGRQIFCRLLKATASDGTFEDLISECIQGNQVFNDEGFLPNQQSLMLNWNDSRVQDKISTWRQFEWLRACDIPSIKEGGVQLSVFYESIDPKDIRQGVLGDCYFLSVLSVLAENPQRIRNLFVNDQANDYGIYGVKICKNGEYREIVVDDKFPCFQGEPAFSKAQGDELWVLILEKAWAKIHGSYERIEAGFAENVLRDLTGAPSEVVHNDDEQLWEKLIQSEKNGYLMAASAGSTKAAKELLENLGLIGNHSYGILDIRQVKLADGSIEKLIKLRNPWGDFEWNGDWGDDSDLWTPELEKQLGQSDGNDGVFFMNLKDFCYYFSRVQICRINDKYKYSSFKCNQNHDSFCLVKFVVQQEGQYTLTLNQIDERCFDRDVEYDYSNARLILGKVVKQSDEGFELEYIGGIMGCQRDTWKEFQYLQKGDYYILAEVDWSDKAQQTEFTLSSYGVASSYFVRDEKCQFIKEDILSKLYGSCAQQELTNCKHTTYEQYQEPNIHKYTQLCEEGYGYAFYQNNSKDSTLKETVTYSKFEGLELLKPSKDQSFTVEVAPNCSKIVLIRQKDPLGFSMSSSTTSAIEFSAEKLKKLCKEEGKMTKRAHPVNKQELEIYQYQFKHTSGICYLYENKTQNKKFEETLKFTLGGLKIVGQAPDAGETVVIKLGPGESKFIELQSIAPQWKISTAVSYGIS